MRRFMLASAIFGLVLQTQVAVAADSIQFNRDIRPILADKCLACHGPDNNKREADLRLDTSEGALADRDGKPPISPGKPEESELVRRILATDPEERMPPASSNKSLTAEQIELLRQWIAQGAKYEPHWALIAPKKAPVPVSGRGWARNEIDYFIAAAHAKQRLSPFSDADRRTLARRLSFDLLGLPPSAEEVDAFAADTSEKAYENFVDRLLASPHFGERLAVYWLDVVRYADSGGYHSDNDRDLAPYRDYVIAAFNENMPFDQFTIEQIAGDLLPQATNRQKIASGYNRLLQTTEEGGAQPKEYAAKYQADRVRNTAVAWLAMTMGCCECHTHKFDPLTIRDFYSFAAFFADVQEKAVGRQEQAAIPTPEQAADLAQLEEQLAKLQSEYLQDRPEFAAARSKWEEQLRADLASGKSDWSVVKPDKLEATKKTTLTLLDDQSVLASGENPDAETYVVSFNSGKEPVTAVRLEVLTHGSLTNKSLSRANGNFVLTELEISLLPANGKKPQAVKIKSADADFSQPNYPVAHAVDGKSDTGWAVAGHEKAADHRAVFLFEKPVPPDSKLMVKLNHDSQFAKHTIGRFRLTLTTKSDPGLSDTGGLTGDALAALSIEDEKRTAEQKEALKRRFREITPDLASLREQIAQLERRKVEIQQSFPKTLVSMSVAPRTVRILPRGNWLDESGEVVQPATPEALPPLKYEDRQLARLELGRWFVRRDQPLTARVFVNRLWKLLFGQGIVKTLDDFGVQGTPPTHPELLDWLAVEFMDSGWNVKHIVKQMVMSRTYQQSSIVSSELRERDPNNLWLARQAAFRLDAEFVRDNALAVSGLLARKLGGPSVKPYQPVGYWRFLNFPTREWQNDHGADLYRRGLYTHWQRTFLQPSLLAFDAPSREECTVDRPRSNTPLQALVLLNDPTYVEAARVLAARVLEHSSGSPAEGLNYAFRQVLQRLPSPKESEILVSLWSKHRDEFTKEPGTADLLLKVGEWPVPTNVNKSELAAWTSVCRAILNLHETITRY